MGRDTDSSSLSSEEDARKRHKSKKKKKSKRNSELNDNNFIFGPALPPNILKKKSSDPECIKKQIIGPTIPEELRINLEQGEERNESEEMNFEYGPIPLNNNMSDTQVELEERALQLKLAAIEGRNTNTVEVKSREEWMLELPEVGLRGGLAALNNLKRTFYHGKERPDLSDRSDWTKTPQDSKNKKNSEATSSKAAAEAQKRDAQQKHDREQERIARKHKLEESLMELHQKKLRKEQKKKEKERLKNGKKLDRRPFSRDVDLKLNKIDSHQTKQIVDKAKILHSKFSSGQAKYL